MMPRTVLSRLALLAAPVLTGCAGGATDEAADHATRMAHEHAGEAPNATPATAGTDTLAVTAREVVYSTLDGRPVTGYLARPEGDESTLPGLVVVHEWWGLNDNVRAMTRRLAAEGYAALAVDLYGGRVAASSDSAQALMQAATARPDSLLASVADAFAYLRAEEHAPRAGIVGWCFGGGWALEAALGLPQHVDAVALYYGRPVTAPSRLAALDAPLLGLFGGADGGIPVTDVRRMEAMLRELGKAATVHVYDGAGHAFANPSGQRYDAPAAEDAWARTTAFFAEHLKR